MKKIFSAALLLLSFFSLMLLQGCVKDSCKKTFTYTIYEPVYKSHADVRANIKSNSPKPVERPGKIYLYGHYIFLNEIDKGIHIINNTNPSAPVNVAFIDIPGNLDLAVKGSTLYADLYTDLVAVDIANPMNASVSKIVENVFPHRAYYNGFVSDRSRVVTDWIKRDTTVTHDCSGGFTEQFDSMGAFVALAANTRAGGGAVSVSPVGMGGSMARFTLSGERLYTVGTSELSVFNVSTPSQPGFVTRKSVGMNIETIFPFRDNLFIGSMNGMFIYNIANPNDPVKTGQFSHVRSCDPVIADDTHAYVTLRSGTACQGFTNQMDVLKLNSLTNPTLEKTYALTNPHGLSKDGNILFLCDGKDGLKIYDATDPKNLVLKKRIGGMETYDVIAWNDVALVVAKDALYQYDYSDLANIRLLSKIAIPVQ